MEKPDCGDIEAKPFLADDEEHATSFKERMESSINVRYKRNRKPLVKERTVFFSACLVHLALICFYTLAYFVATHDGGIEFKLLHDTIRDLDIRTRPTEYVVAGLSPYAGGPTAEIDGAWHQLLANISIRVSDEELARNGDRQNSVSLPDGGGQMAWLGVFHQLHCLKKLRQLNYPQAYAPNLTEDQRWDQEVHINHCIELLRQSVMCNPDTSLTTFSWSRTKLKPVLNIGGFERQCVDWEAFMSNILPRVVGANEVDALVNPNLVNN